MRGSGTRPGRRARPWPGRAALGLVMAGLALLSGGCWDRVEVNDLALVEGVALDRAGPDRLRLTVSMSVPSRVRTPGSFGGAGTGLPSSAAMAGEGRTVVEAIDAVQRQLGRRLFWGHTEAILLGEDLARSGLGPVLDYFSRHPEPRLRTFVAVVPGRAADVLGTLATIEPATATAIRKMAALRPELMTTLRDFLAQLLAEDQEPVLPIIALAPRGAPQPGTLETPPGQSAMPPPAQQQNPVRPVLAGTAVFKADRLVGLLDAEETRGLLWVRGEPIDATTTVALGEPGRYVSFRITRSGTRLTPRFQDDRPVMEVRVFSEHDLIEDTAGLDMDDTRVVTLIQRALARTIESSIRRAAVRVQTELRSDVFGFGAAIRRQDPRRWKALRRSWDRLFPQVPMDLRVEALMRRGGLSSRPLSRPRPELLPRRELERLLEGP